MSVSISTLGERALRRLGVAIVPVADRPMLVSMMTPAAVATGALVELGVIASDETPSPTDQALALSKVTQVQASLASQALVWWDDDGIPMAVAEEYTRMAASQLASAFGKQADLQAYTLMEQRVRRMALILSAPDIANQAVQAIHDNLTARGLARWTVFDIPVAAELPYELLAANRLAPGFDRQVDPGADILATRALVQIIALGSSGERIVGEYF